MGNRIVALFLALTLSPVLAGTGSGEGPNHRPQDVDHELRAAVAWIMKLEGLRVVKSQRSEDYNEYRLDQSQAKQVMDSIRDGLTKRAWKYSEKKAEDGSETISASKEKHQLTISLQRKGDEPRLIVEIVETE